MACLKRKNHPPLSPSNPNIAPMDIMLAQDFSPYEYAGAVGHGQEFSFAERGLLQYFTGPFLAEGIVSLFIGFILYSCIVQVTDCGAGSVGLDMATRGERGYDFQH